MTVYFLFTILCIISHLIFIVIICEIYSFLSENCFYTISIHCRSLSCTIMIIKKKKKCKLKKSNKEKFRKMTSTSWSFWRYLNIIYIYIYVFFCLIFIFSLYLQMSCLHSQQNNVVFTVAKSSLRSSKNLVIKNIPWKSNPWPLHC